MDSAGATETQIRDATNQFYTLIPHDFSIRKMKPLRNIKIIEEKVELLRSLEDLEVAYGVLKSESMDEDKDPIDIHYEALKTDFEVLPKDSADFKMLQEFVKNTHGETHKLYVLELEEVFKIRRHGEVEKFQKNLHNRMLLWHGSLLSNYVGILSQGLRIAPPEAPLVALGDMHDLKHSDSGLPIVSKLPEGKNSTRGLGKIIPDPKGKRVIEDGVIVPMGKGIKSQEQGLDLMYNEYVVYNVDQMKMRYLLKCKFVPVYDCT